MCPGMPLPDPIKATLEIRWSTRSVFIPLCENPLDTGVIELLGWISYDRNITPEVDSIMIPFIETPVGPTIVIDQTSNPDSEIFFLEIPPEATEIVVPVIGSYSAPDPPPHVLGTMALAWGNADRTIYIPLVQDIEAEGIWAIPIRFVGSTMTVGLIPNPCLEKTYMAPLGYNDDDPNFEKIYAPIPTESEGLIIPQNADMISEFPPQSYEPSGN